MSETQGESPRRLVHTERISLRWGDMDAMGHVNNTVYFRFMEQARIGWFDALVPEVDAWKSTGIVVASTTCNFRRPMTYPGIVEVKVYAGRPGASSVTTYYELGIRADETLYADGSAVVVFIDMERQKPMRIPDGIRERLQ